MANRNPIPVQSIPGSTVKVDNGLMTVEGFGEIPFNGDPVPGSIPVVDPNGLQVNWKTTVPQSNIPDMPLGGELGGTVSNAFVQPTSSYRRIFMLGMDGS